MSQRAILELTFRLMGLYFLIRAILLLPDVLFMLYRYTNDLRGTITGALLFSTSLKVTTFLLCFLFFFLRGGRLADLGAGGRADGSGIPQAARLPAAIFSAVGVLVGSLAVSDLLAPLVYAFADPAVVPRPGFMYTHWPRFGGGVLQALFGVVLFLSGLRLARFWVERRELEKS